MRKKVLAALLAAAVAGTTVMSGMTAFAAETEGTKAEGGNITISLEDYAACNINIAKGKKADLVDVEVMSNSEEKKKLVAELQKE